MRPRVGGLLGLDVGVLVWRRPREPCRGGARPPGIELAQASRHDRDQAGVPRRTGDVAELEGVAVLVVELLLVGLELDVLPRVRRLSRLREQPPYLGEVGNLPVP